MDRSASNRGSLHNVNINRGRTESVHSLFPEEPSRRASSMLNISNDANPSSPLTMHDNTTTATVHFDKLEKLGPSLLDVLTYVHPPQPKPKMEMNCDAQSTNVEEVASSPAPDHTATFDTCLSRSAILARLLDPKTDQTRKVQELIASILETIKCEATGVVLLHDATVLLFLETTADEFLSICKLLDQRGKTVVETTSMRILASCDDNPLRLLQGLHFRKITINRSSGNEQEWTDEMLRPIAVETFLNVIKFVKKLSPMSSTEIRKVLTNLANSDQLLLPSDGLIQWFLKCEEMITISEFLEIYNDPIHVELESERVWPIHPLFLN